MSEILAVKGMTENEWTSFILKTERVFQGMSRLGKNWDQTSPDMVSDTYCVEVDWCHKWAESIGQASFYSKIANKDCGILLLFPDIREYEAKISGLRAQLANSGKFDLYFYDCESEKLVQTVRKCYEVKCV